MNQPTIPALPLHQPWASLVALGAKRIETRHWPAPQRLIGEPIAVYATRGGLSQRDERTLLDDILFHDALCQTVKPYQPWPSSKAIADALPRGALLATVVIDRCVQIDESRNRRLAIEAPREFAFGDYEPGRYAWVLRDVQVLPKPVVWRSREEDGWKPTQGIFRVPASAVGLAPTQETLPLEGAA